MATERAWSADRLPAGLVLPRLSPALTMALRRADAGGTLPPPGVPLLIPGVDPQVAAVEARDALRRWAVALRPIEARQLAFWLAPLNLRRDPPLSAAALRTRAAGVLPHLAGIPAPLLHIGTQSEALGTFRELPTGAALRRLLQPHAEAVERRRDILRRLAAAPPQPRPPPPDEASRAAVAEKLAAWRAEMREREAEMLPERRPPGARYLTPQQLVAHWRAAAERAQGTVREAPTAANLARAEAAAADG